VTCQGELANLLLRYKIPETSEAGDQFLRYLSLLEKWGRRFNLVGSLSWENLGPLFEEGLWAGLRYPKKALVHLDIGSGAGFPAIPIRILNRTMQLQLIESQTKRAVFLETACETLGIREVTVHNCTLRSFLKGDEEEGEWDCISWKALKLGRKDFSLLVSRSKEGVSFWIFHGSEIPIEGGELDPALRFCVKEGMPGKKKWYLSVYERHA
jgi:16S rRNA (guanine527-N7)-methyltransferase